MQTMIFRNGGGGDARHPGKRAPPICILKQAFRKLTKDKLLVNVNVHVIGRTFHVSNKLSNRLKPILFISGTPSLS